MKVCSRMGELWANLLQLIQANNIWAFASSKILKGILWTHNYFVNNYWKEVSDIHFNYRQFLADISKWPSSDKDDFLIQMKRLVWIFWKDSLYDTKGAPIAFNEIIWNPESFKRFLLEWIVITKPTISNPTWIRRVWKMVDLTERSINAQHSRTFKELIKWDPITWIPSSITEKMFDDFAKIFLDTDTLYSKWFNMRALYRYVWASEWGWDFFQTLFTNSHASMRAAVADSMNLSSVWNVPWWTMEKLKKKLAAPDWWIWWDRTVLEIYAHQLLAEFQVQWINPTREQLWKLVADTCWYSLNEWWAYYKLLAESRWVYRFFKYWPLALIPSTILWLNAITVWTTMFLAKKIWLWVSYKNELVDYLIKEHNVLRVESKTKDYSINAFDELWWTTLDRIIDYVVNPAKYATLNTFLKWWSQTIPEMLAENFVKRFSVARAMHSIWITDRNAKQILDELKAWKELDFDIIKAIHAQSSLEWKNFFWTSSIFALNRHSWSRNMIVNCMQWYMLSRAWEFISQMHRFAVAIQNWKISSGKSFVDFINKPENLELKSMLTLPLVAAKIAWYTDSVLNKDDDTPKATRMAKYWMWLNDTYQSMTSNFFSRFFLSAIDNTWAYIEYTDATWESRSLYWYAKSWAYWVLAWIASQMYRELKVFDFVWTPVKNLIAWYGLNDALATTWEEFDKMMNWLWRFWLLPWLDTFDMKTLPQQDDFFWMMLMNIHETNESIKTSNRFRSMADIEMLLNPKDDEYPMLKVLTYLPILKYLYKDDMSIAWTMNKKMLWLVETDPVLKELYKGNFDKRVLTKENIDPLYKELTSADFTSMRVDERLKSELNKYWLNSMKQETFIQLLEAKMMERHLLWKWQTLLDTVAAWSPDQKKMWLAKIIAFAENEVPWSHRVLLSYMVWKTYDAAVKEHNNNLWVKWLSSYQLTPSEDMALKASLIQQFYPQMFAADKTSWYRLINQRLNTLDPKGFKIDDSMMWFVNSLWFLDMMAYNESRKADSSAPYIKNVYSLIGKYVTDPKQRINLMIAANETIQNLPTEQWVRNTMRLWTVLWNIDILDKVLKDKVFVAANEEIVNKALNITFWTVADINTQWLQAAREDIWESWTWWRWSKAYRQWLYSAWKKYNPGQYDNANRKATQDLEDKIPSLLRNAPASYTPKRFNNPWYNVEAKYNIPKPVEYKDYLEWSKVFNPNKAESAQLVSWYVRRNPQDVFDKSTTRMNYKTPQFKTIASIKIPKGKRIWKNPAYQANA